MAVWQRPLKIGHTEAVRGATSVSSPLLAGFSLTAVVILSTSSPTPRYVGVAIALFVVAAVLLMIAVDLGIRVVQNTGSPEERLAWRPEARRSRSELEMERRLQRLDHANSRIFSARARAAHNLGVAAFLAGTLATLVPENLDSSRIASLGGLVAPGIVLVALMLHAMAWLRSSPRWVFGSMYLKDIDNPEPLSDAEWRSVATPTGSVPIQQDARWVCVKVLLSVALASLVLLWGLLRSQRR